MENIRFAQDMNIVKIMAAEARRESVDSDKLQEAHNTIVELAQYPSPDHKFAIGQLIGFTINEIDRDAGNNWEDNVAHLVTCNFGETPQFIARLEGIRAVVQAKGATTPRSKIANKTVTLDTVAVSAEPVVNIVEMQNGRVNMADLINDAHYQMKLAELGYYQKTLLSYGRNFKKLYYGYGNGFDPVVVDPMIRHWMKLSRGALPSILGSIDIIHKIVRQTGFTPIGGGNTQYNNEIIGAFHQTGIIGNYVGANVVNLMNPVVDGTDEFVLNDKIAFVLPNFADKTMRPLKIVKEGTVQAQDYTDIDDKSYVVRLDQYIGAGVVYGDRPYMSIYEDKSN